MVINLLNADITFNLTFRRPKRHLNVLKNAEISEQLLQRKFAFLPYFSREFMKYP